MHLQLPPNYICPHHKTYHTQLYFPIAFKEEKKKRLCDGRNKSIATNRKKKVQKNLRV